MFILNFFYNFAHSKGIIIHKLHIYNYHRLVIKPIHKRFIAIPKIIRKVVIKCFYIIEHPRKYYRYTFLRMFITRFSYLYSDRKFLEIMFPLCTGYKLDIDHPRTFNEKLQWLKLNYHKPEFTIMVDKAEAKKYVAKIIGEEHIIPTIKVYNTVDEIDFDSLPDQFVMKCTHDSGNLVICTDKSIINRKAILNQFKKGLMYNFYNLGKEWVYKNVTPRIIVEKYMTDNGEELKDYKIFNFGGEPRIIEVDYERFKDHKRQFFTTEWNRIEATCIYPSGEKVIEKPKQLEQMLEFARKLSKGHPFIRTDFYIVNENVYFGELTFYHESGYGQIQPFELDLEMGSWIQLPDPIKDSKHNRFFFYKLSRNNKRNTKQENKITSSIKNKNVSMRHERANLPD